MERNELYEAAEKYSAMQSGFNTRSHVRDFVKGAEHILFGMDETYAEVRDIFNTKLRASTDGSIRLSDKGVKDILKWIKP